MQVVTVHAADQPPEVVERRVALARRMIELGAAVFPLARDSKKPLIGKASGGKGFLDASADPDMAETFLRNAGQPNYGLAFPEGSDIFVLDLDGGDRSSRPAWRDEWQRLYERLGPPGLTYIVRTPSGGRHAYYRWRTDLYGPMPPGDEMLGWTVRKPWKGYLVGPGSVVNGQTYEPAGADAIADFPEAWAKAALAERGESRPTSPTIRIKGGPADVQTGHRHAFLRDRARALLGAGLTGDALFAAVMDLNRQLSEPKTDDEVRRAIGEVETRFQPDPLPAEQVAAARPRAEIEASSIDAADLLELEIPPLTWIVPELIPEGTTVLAGPPKLGKSCLVYQIAVEVAVGGELLDRDVDAGDVLYLALEDGKRRGQMRLRGALGDRPMPRGRLEVRWAAARIGEGLEQEIVDWLDAHPNARLVAVDTLQRVRGRADSRRNAYEVDVEDLGRLQNLFRDRPVALLIVHHSKKDAGDDFLASVSGTYGITGSVDTTLVIQRKRLDPFGKLVVTGRDIAEIEQPVQFANQLWRPAPEDVAEATFERAQIYRVLQVAEKPLMPAEIARETGLEANSVSHMLAKMRRAGSVARTTGGWAVAGVVLAMEGSEGSKVDEMATVDHSDHSGDASRAPARRDLPDHSDHSVHGETASESDRSDRGHAPTRASREAVDLTVVHDEAGIEATGWCHFPADHARQHRDVLTDSPWCEICSPREERA